MAAPVENLLRPAWFGSGQLVRPGFKISNLVPSRLGMPKLSWYFWQAGLGAAGAVT
jgi:hypothetical protein